MSIIQNMGEPASTLRKSSDPSCGGRGGGVPPRRLKVFVMDLWSYVPYYDGYLCKSLRDANVDVTVGTITYHLDCGLFKRHALSNDPGLVDLVAKLKIRTPSVRRLLKFLEFCLNCAALAVRFTFAPPDILHVQYIPLIEKGLPFEPWFLRYAKKLGIKLVYTVHNVLPPDTGGRLRAAYQRIYKLPEALICHNQSARTQLIEEFGVPPERIWLIPHGPMFFDCQRRTPEEARKHLGYQPEQCIVLWQGIVNPYKGIDFLLDAWKEIQASEPHARLVIAGTGEKCLLRGVEEKARMLGIEGSVRLDLRYLPVEEVALHYQAADIVVYPYKEITTSGALMTGLTYRKPLVATALPPFREILKDGENAALVEYGDVKGLARILSRLIEDPAERNRLAAGITAAGPQWNPWARIAEQTRDCYEALL